GRTQIQQKLHGLSQETRSQAATGYALVSQKREVMKQMKTQSNIRAYITGSAARAGFLSFAFITLGLAVNSPNGWHKPAQATAIYNRTTEIPVQARALTFAERVAYQRAIEGVYWRHRIWPKENPDPKPSLDAVMSQAQLERKVEDYLSKSQTL